VTHPLAIRIAWCVLALGAVRSSSGESSVQFLDGASQAQPITAAYLAGGPGSDYIARLPLGGAFTLRVNSDQSCRISVRRENTGLWFVEGQLLVQLLKSGGAADERDPVPVGTAADTTLLDSPQPLIDQTYELRYLFDGMSVKNPPGTYVTHVSFTVTDLP
jgi:hypothetical protein